MRAVDIALGLGAIILLTLATAFFVAAEFALVASDRNKVERLAEEGHRGARSLFNALKELSFELSGCQLGITVTSLLVGFIVEPTIGEAMAPLLEGLGLPESSALGISVALALVLATAIQMVVGELIPKNLAVARSLQVGLVVVTPLRLLNLLAKPLILFLNASANALVRALGIEPRDELSSVRSLEELELLIQSSRQEGELPEEEAALLARSIAFWEKTAGDALVPRVSVTAVQHDSSVADLVSVAVDTGHSRFPVYRGNLDDIIGLAHIKDIHRVPYGDRASAPVTEMTQDPLLVPESQELGSLLAQMRRERKHLAIVLDEYGGTAGILTIEDLLEEIIGDIEDEYDPSANGPELTSPPEGVYLVSGMLHRDELQDATNLALPEGDYDTLAGWLLTRFERIPEKGDQTSFGEWEFKIVAMDNRRIDKVLVAAPGAGKNEQVT
ncbi:MAG: HlyC/CorC family transporter [Actinobacteria bacterium]|nr:HlyC/CorC family transporter [Actinomycetota bacterium]